MRAGDARKAEPDAQIVGFTQLALTFYKVARPTSLFFLFMLSIDPNGVLASALKFINLLVAGHGRSRQFSARRR